MPRVPTVRQADLDRAIRALKGAGLGVGRIEVRPGGEVVIVPAPLPKAGDDKPSLTPETPAGELSDLDRFRLEKQRRGHRAAQGS